MQIKQRRNNGQKNLEARVAKLEKIIKNESRDRLTVGELIDYLSQFGLDKKVQFEIGDDILRPIDAGDIYDAGDSVNFDFTRILLEIRQPIIK